jgi:hypothetical protein
MIKIAIIIQKRGFGDLRGGLKRGAVVKLRNGLNPVLPFATLAMITFFMMATWGEMASGQEVFEKIAAVGSPIPAVKKETQKANQSQVVWYQGYWWGVFKDSNTSNWYVYKYASNAWNPDRDTGIHGGAETDVHIDETNGKLYVLVSSGAHDVSRLSFNAGVWELDNGFPKDVGVLSANSDVPACFTRAADGDLFIFFVHSNDLKGLYSTDQGVTWTNSFAIASVPGIALTDAIAFRYNNIYHIGVFVGRGDGAEFSFRRLEDSKDPADSTNWVKETLPISDNSDDHVNIVRDSAHNLYMIGKRGDSNIFRLYKRNNSNNWSYFNILPDYGTRPSLAIDESNNSLIIIGSIENGTEVATTIQYTVLDKNNLHDVGPEAWTPVLENGLDSFNNATVSYQVLDNTTNLMVCASNDSKGQVWYNLLNVDDIALPVFLASFQATPGVERINLEWVTHSEVDNWEWILYRRQEGQDQFRELTRLPGNGTTNSITYYTYSDADVRTGIVYAYRLANVDFNGRVNYYPEIVKSALMPLSSFKLYANYPNPFNAQTTASFEIGEHSYTRLYIYDMMGRLVKRLFEGYLSPGSYNYKWNGKDDYDEDVASGVYLLNLSAGQYQESGKMILSR